MVRPDLTSRRFQRQLKRHMSAKDRATERETPHSIWTRVDLLTGDKTLKHSSSRDKEQWKETRDLKVQLLHAEKQRELDSLKNRAFETFEEIERQ